MSYAVLTKVGISERIPAMKSFFMAVLEATWPEAAEEVAPPGGATPNREAGRPALSKKFPEVPTNNCWLIPPINPPWEFQKPIM